MHPLLAQRRSLGAYLLFWACLSVVPFLLLQAAAPLGALVLAAICTVAFALITLPSYYLCRALPLGPGRLARVSSAHGAAAIVWSLVFLVCWKAFVEVLAYVPAWHGLPNDVDRAEPALLGVGALFYLLVATFHYMLAELDLRRDAIEREAALALNAQRAELQALRAQVHPHFLFNSLNTVNALIGYDPGKAREACVLLADYLRGTLGAQEHALVPLGDEWALCERYLAVEKLRLGERLALDVELDEQARACLVPSLLLQPLVENAMTHGISRVSDPAPLRVRALVRGERLVVVIENGIDPEPRRRPGGVGLANVRARLAAQYGDTAILHVERDATKFRVVVKLPARSPASPEAR
ncbi:MAG TPA: histidine kinase [Polyangiaceae bacterium]|nr:histidine kinase [Polyangiaceae bacterium]